ncbi:MAG: hypothetical protein IMW85_07435 [Thermicanus sp.]|nr:hypothetical protein [Thermicanus sp.]
MEKRRKFFPLMLIAGTFFLLALSGCSTYPSGDRNFGPTEEAPPSVSGGETKQTVPFTELISHAVETNRNAPMLQKFWFSGWVSNTVEKRKTTSMYSGVMILPHGYYVDARMAGTPYRYYKWDEYNFLWTERDDWMRAGEDQFPLDPFLGFDWWMPALDRAVSLPDEEILNHPTKVFELKLSGEEMASLLQQPFFPAEVAKLSATPDWKNLLKQTEATATFWIGDDTYTKEEVAAQAKKAGKGEGEAALAEWVKENRLTWDEKGKVYHQNPIYQFNVLIEAPVPKAGYMNQEIFFRFYHYNDPAIKIQTPEEILKYVEDEK